MLAYYSMAWVPYAGQTTTTKTNHCINIQAADQRPHKPTGNRLVYMLALLRVARATGTPKALAPLVAKAKAKKGFVHCTGCPCPSKCPGSTACTQAQAKGKGLDGLQVGYNHRKQRG